MALAGVAPFPRGRAATESLVVVVVVEESSK
jgi:hypothetical protein